MRRGKGIDGPSLLGLPLAVAVVLLAQVAEGGSVRSLWQPTAAMVVFGGHGCGGPRELSARSRAADVRGRRPGVSQASHARQMEATVGQLLRWAIEARAPRHRRARAGTGPHPRGFPAQRADAGRRRHASDMRAHILEIESYAHRVVATARRRAGDAAGYTPTLGILGAVLRADPRNGEASASRPARLRHRRRVRRDGVRRGYGQPDLLPLATRIIARRDAAADAS